MQKGVESRVGKGQFSTELLVILGVVLVVIGAGIVLTQNIITNTDKTQQENQAQGAVDSLTATANEVYAQGEGARKRIYVILPKNYDFANSYVRNRTVLVKAGGKDFASNLDFDVRGVLPQAEGGIYTWVTSEGNRVRIGDPMFVLSKYQVGMILNNNNTQNDSFTITNIYGSAINLTLATIWTHPDVSLTVVPSVQQNAEDNGTISVNITVVASENTTGFYSGRIDINGSRGNISELVSVPVTVEITYVLNVKAPPLSITPSLWNVSMEPNQTVSKSFLVCTNALTSVEYVNFNASLGAPGAWVGGLSSMGALGPETCETKVLNLTVPGGTANDNYSGYITGDGGVAGAQDSVALDVQVGGNLSDILGPLINTTSKSPTRSFYGDAVTITAKADDSTTGNSSIKFCEIQLDNGTWNIMAPSDGSYSGPVEFANYIYNGLNVSSHNATMRCTDAWNNVGPYASIGFRVIKGILFVFKDSGTEVPEQDWKNYLDTHTSSTGIKWIYDTASRQDLSDGKVDKLNYAAMLVAGDSFDGALGTTLKTNINSHVAAGGYALFVDIAAGEGLVSMALGNNSRTVSHNHIHINNTNHYITSPYTTNGTGILYIYTPYYADQWVVDRIGYQGYYLAAPTAITSPYREVVLGDAVNASRLVTWGATRPYRFNSNGVALTGRFFDFGVNASTIK